MKLRLQVQYSTVKGVVTKNIILKLAHNELLYAGELYVQAVGPSMKADSEKQQTSAYYVH